MGNRDNSIFETKKKHVYNFEHRKTITSFAKENFTRLEKLGFLMHESPCSSNQVQKIGFKQMK